MALSSAIATDQEADQVKRLRARDEAAFTALIERYYGTMLAVAQMYVQSRAVAEEVVQEAWLGVLNGIDRFEGRSTLRTWITAIVINIAKRRAVREARSVPSSSLTPEGEEPAVEPERFRRHDEAFPGHWKSYPRDWRELPEDALFNRETLEVVKGAIEELPAGQRAVITMRDVAGFSPEEVCKALEVTDGNQRVLLHRARSHVRAVLERHLDE